MNINKLEKIVKNSIRAGGDDYDILERASRTANTSITALKPILIRIKSEKKAF